MHNTTIYHCQLAPQNFEMIRSMLSQYERVTLVSVETIQDIPSETATDQLDSKFLIIDNNTSATQLLTFTSTDVSKFLNIKILWLSPNPLNPEIIDVSKISSYFKKVDILYLDLSIMRKVAAIYDFIKSDSISPLPERGATYIPLKLSYLEAIHKAPCDIFLKISDRKYIKIINKDDDFKIREMIKEYADRDISEFYVTFDNLSKFKDGLISNIFKKTDSDSESKTNLQLTMTQTALAIVKDFGVSDFIIDGINDVMTDIYRDYNSNPKLKDLLSKMKMIEGSSLGTHSHLTLIFNSLIGAKTPWYNREVKKNLCTASLLHDLDLLETNLEDYEFRPLDEINTLKAKDRELVKGHSNSLAAKLAKIDLIPSDVINIISKHHEGAGTNSYPQGLHGPQLAPPICLFVIAHQFSILLHAHEYKVEKLSDIFSQLKMFYSGNSFKPFIEILEKELSEK